MSDDLVAFLRARLDEDERMAQAVTPLGYTMVMGVQRADENWVLYRSVPSGLDGMPARNDDPAARAHFFRHDPRRVLREVEANRRLIKRYENALAVGTSVASFTRGQDDGYRQGCLDVIRDKAEVYADRPGYQEAWRPE